MAAEPAPANAASTKSHNNPDPLIPMSTLFPKMSTETSKKWSQKVSIDSSFLNILASRTTAAPNIRSGKLPSFADSVTRVYGSPSSGKGKTRDRWKIGMPVTSSRPSIHYLPSPGAGPGSLLQGLTSGTRVSSRERRGTVPANLVFGENQGKGYLRVADAVFAGSRFRKLLNKRTSSRERGLEREPATRSRENKSPESPKSPKRVFKDLAYKALVDRRVSEGSASGHAPDIGDVFMKELYRQVDRKKMAKLRHIAAVQAMLEEKKRLLRKFQMAVHITLWCIKTSRRHCVQAQESGDLSSFFNMNFSAMETFEGVELLFDPSKFKANRQARISKEMKKIFRKLPQDRTEQEVYYAQIALRNIKCFAEFPDRMQKKIAEVGMYDKFDARRVLLRQGHPAHAFYFILSGAVSVLVLEEGRAIAKAVAELEKGQSFGELAIITRGKRQSNVVVKEKSEFLSVSVDDYHKIFMSGGVKSVNDPDHDLFLKSLPFLQGWPVHKLQEEDAKSVFLYFKRGDVIVKDSKYSNWIIVVKSGSLAVLKKLRKVEAYEWKKPKAFTFVSDKEKRERHEKLTKQRKQILPELQVPLKGELGSSYEDDQIRENGKLRPFVHPTDSLPPMVIVSDGGSDAKVWDLGSPDASGSGLNNMSYVHVPRDTSRDNAALAQKENREPGTNGDMHLKPEESMLSDGLFPVPEAEESDTGSLARSSPVDQSSAQKNGEKLMKMEVRTIQQELDGSGAQRDPDDITAADLNPEFVHVQTLTKGMCFGLSDLILGQDTSFCVVSNGADVLLINKQLYQENASECLQRRMRQDLCPYPSEEELQTRLQTSVDWDAYRQATLADTLKAVRMRKETPIRI